MKKFSAIVEIVSISPLLILVGLAVSYVAYRMFPIPLVPGAESTLEIIGGIAIIIGTISVVVAQRASRTMHKKIQNATVLDFMQGPYRYSRHPGALGLMLMYVGFAFVANSLVMTIIAGIFIILETTIFIPMEEDMLIMQCPNAYREYKTKVRMWI